MCVEPSCVWVQVLSVQGLKHQQEAEPSNEGSFSVLDDGTVKSL